MAHSFPVFRALIDIGEATLQAIKKAAIHSQYLPHAAWRFDKRQAQAVRSAPPESGMRAINRQLQLSADERQNTFADGRR
jgi:hypothetical protein